MKILPSLSRYIVIGGIVFVIYIGLFQLLILAQIYRPLATTIAYILAVSCHFLLNKYFNFKNFKRSTTGQLRTYLVVVSFCWVVTLLTIEVCVRVLGLTPLWAQMIAIAVNIPTGFVANNYLTFGSGIRSMLRKWLQYLR